jgi:membrane associated rhomboid family serine protease
MLLPIAHEETFGRRWPVATAAIIAACVVCFVAMLATSGAGTRAVRDAATSAAEYWQDHPYLTVPPSAARLLSARNVAPAGRQLPPGLEELLPPHAPEEPDDEERAAEQAHFDDLCAQLQKAMDELPVRRFGYVPANNNWLGLLTSQFLHGGWLHLIFNMWFLWLCGCNLEDRWGRRVFVPFYLAAGVVAGLAHKLSVPDSVMPVIGASGAIAGAMGAFLVSFARARIRFFYWFFLFRYGTFLAPAYVMLPLWLFQELFFGMAGSGDGVAHWAHVGGFGFGVAFALVLRATGLDRKLDDAMEATTLVTRDERIERAAKMTSEGHARAALGLLARVVVERPDDLDVHQEMLRAARAAGDRPREARAYAELLRLYLKHDGIDAAYALVLEAKAEAKESVLPAEARMVLAEHLLERRRAEEAWRVYASITGSGLGDETAVRAALAQVRLRNQLPRKVHVRALLEAVMESPFASKEMDDAARVEIAQLDREAAQQSVPVR